MKYLEENSCCLSSFSKFCFCGGCANADKDERLAHQQKELEVKTLSVNPCNLSGLSDIEHIMDMHDFFGEMFIDILCDSVTCLAF